VSVTEDALALAFRTGMPFVGLRDHAHDPELDRLIPSDAARTARAIPLTADDDRVRLAVADPATDLSTLDRYIGGRQVELALAPREEIDTILGPPPAPAEAATEQRGTQAAEQEAEPLVEADPEALATEEPAPTTPAPITEPDSLTAEQPAPSDATAEPDLLTAEQPALSDAAPSEPDSLAAETEHSADSLVAQEPAPTGAAADAPRSLVADPEPQVVAEDDAQLAGEVPSWLEPPRRRWWRAALTVLFVLVVLAAAAVIVLALGNA
jgi:hypothetical protein